MQHCLEYKSRAGSKRKGDIIMKEQHAIGPFVDVETEILIIGAFYPKSESDKKRQDGKEPFYYDSPKDAFWSILPQIFCGSNCDLTDAGADEQRKFLKRYKIGLIDLIAEAELARFAINSLQSGDFELTDILAQMKQLKNLKKVAFNRSDFNNGPNEIKIQKEQIEVYCQEKQIDFAALTNTGYRAQQVVGGIALAPRKGAFIDGRIIKIAVEWTKFFYEKQSK
jgi:G:T/U-mismatch repair DNA glycosylase